MCTRMLGNTTLAEDAVQEIMLKLWKKRKDFGNHPNISGYVFVTARNYCLDKLKQNRLKIVSDSDHYKTMAESTNNADMVEWQELNSIIREILAELPEQQKEVLLLRDIDGYEYQEISDILKLKIEHVRVLAARARQHVGMQLEKTYCYERGQY